jgi:hypothetical protein
MGTIRRFFAGLNPARLERGIADADRAAQATGEAARALAGEIARHEAKLTELRREIDFLTAATRHYPPVLGLRAEFDALCTRLSQSRQRISAIDHELAALEQHVLARCRILATTVYRTYVSKAAPRQFDVVVIDEASMLMPPLVYYAAGLARQAVTVAGDFRQLPPIVSSSDPLAKKWLKCDVFEKAGIPEQLHGRQPTPCLVALRTQYRMRESICEVLNRFFYPDQPLRSDPGVSGDAGPFFPLGSSPLLYLDTATLHPWAALRGRSHYNLLHAVLVRNIILRLAEVGFLPPLGEPNDALGVVAPYAAQAQLIQTLLQDRIGPRAAGVSATVHRFQGNEKAAMVLDLTDSPGVSLGGFLQSVRLEEDGARLLNVAMSRARHHIVLLGNFRYLRAKAGGAAIVRRLIDYFQRHGATLDLQSLLSLAECEGVDGHRAVQSSFDLPEGTAGAFTESTFYPSFFKDLSRARESIIILSPFATRPGITRWVETLRAAIARSVRVRILTLPFVEPGRGTTAEVEELLQNLGSLGVAVGRRNNMHEKIAILDGRILWHGSLNILSHRDAHESMLRIESPGACGQLARSLRL